MPLLAQAQESLASSLRSTRALMDRQQYEQALQQVQELEGPAATSEQALTLLLYKGLILANMGASHKESATTAFKSALSLAPDVRLPLKVSPRIAREFEELRARVHAERKRIAASPPALALRPAVAKEVSRPSILVPTIAGGGLLVLGGTFWGLAKQEQSRLRNPEEFLTEEDIDRSTARGTTYQTLGFSLLGTGVVGLGVATTLYLRRKSEEPAHFGVGVSSTSISAYGRWP